MNELILPVVPDQRLQPDELPGEFSQNDYDSRIDYMESVIRSNIETGRVDTELWFDRLDAGDVALAINNMLAADPAEARAIFLETCKRQIDAYLHRVFDGIDPEDLEDMERANGVGE